MSIGFQNSNVYAIGMYPIASSSSWTPVVSAGTTPPTTLTYSVQYGRYQRLGNVVAIDFSIQLSAFTLGPGSGDLIVSGLPVASINSSHAGDIALTTSQVNFAGTPILITFHVLPNTSTAKIQISTNNAASSYVDISVLKSNSVIQGSGIYFIG